MKNLRSAELVPGLMLCVVACAPESPDQAETQAIGQMLRAGQAQDGEAVMSFDVLLTKGNDGPVVSCEAGKLSVEVEVSTDQGHSYELVADHSTSVVCSKSQAPDIALVVDNSGSENGQFEALRAASEQLIDALSEMGGRTSLVRVSTEANVIHPLTDDTKAARSSLDQLSINNGWTALYDGVRLANETLGSAVVEEDTLGDFQNRAQFCQVAGRRGIVLFTDGQENNSAGEHATAEYPGDGLDTTLSDLENLKVRGSHTPIYSVGLGDNVDHEALRELARASGGKHHHATNVKALGTMFRRTSATRGHVFRCAARYRNATVGASTCGSTTPTKGVMRRWKVARTQPSTFLA